MPESWAFKELRLVSLKALVMGHDVWDHLLIQRIFRLKRRPRRMPSQGTSASVGVVSLIEPLESRELLTAALINDVLGEIASLAAPPSITAFDGSITHAEGTPTIVDSNARVFVGDSGHLRGGTLVVSISQNREATDVLGIAPQGSGPRKIDLDGDQVFYGDVLIGTVSSDTDLSITLNDNATPDAVTALLRRIQFLTLSDNPSTAPRTVSVLLTDPSGVTSNMATKTVLVRGVNDPPVIAMEEGEVLYSVGGNSVLLAPNPTIQDVDSPNISGGVLTITIAENGEAFDRLTLQPSDSLTIYKNQIRLHGVLIGTFNEGNGLDSPFTARFNAAATVETAQEVLRHLHFASTSESPSMLTRTVAITLSDGDGGLSNPVHVDAHLRRGPSITAFDGSITHAEGTPTIVDSNARVFVGDTGHLRGGTLVVSITQNREATDVLGIAPQGSGPRMIDIDGEQVFYGDVQIGTVASDTNLSITLNDNATPDAVTALLRRIQFLTLSDNPSTAPRTVSVLLTEPSGVTSNMATKAVLVRGVNDPPVIAMEEGEVLYSVGENSVQLAPNPTIQDVDSPSISGGVLTVTIAENGEVFDRLTLQPSDSLTIYKNQIRLHGVLIGTFSEGNGPDSPFTVRFNAAATVETAQEVLRHLHFASSSESPSMLTRTVAITLSDGDGGLSNPVHVDVQVARLDAAKEAPATVGSRLLEMLASEGIRFVALGDSTEAGAGTGSSSPYGELREMHEGGAANHAAYALAIADPAFIPLNDAIHPVVTPNTPLARQAPLPKVPLPSWQLTTTADSTVVLPVESDDDQGTRLVTVYYLQRTHDEAAQFQMTIRGPSNEVLGSAIIDTYVEPQGFDEGNSIPPASVFGRWAKATIELTAITDALSITIDGIETVDRGNGRADAGTAVIFGFATGNGVLFRNLAVSGTTLTSKTSANRVRGVETDERLEQAFALQANLFLIGFGTNDSKVGVTTIEQFEADYDQLIARIRSQMPDAVIVLSTDPRGLAAPYMNNPAYNEAIRRIAARNHCELLDVEALFDTLSSDHYRDSVHPSPLGYQAIATALSELFWMTDPDIL